MSGLPGNSGFLSYFPTSPHIVYGFERRVPCQRPPSVYGSICFLTALHEGKPKKSGQPGEKILTKIKTAKSRSSFWRTGFHIYCIHPHKDRICHAKSLQPYHKNLSIHLSQEASAHFCLGFISSHIRTT